MTKKNPVLRYRNIYNGQFARKETNYELRVKSDAETKFVLPDLLHPAMTPDLEELPNEQQED